MYKGTRLHNGKMIGYDKADIKSFYKYIRTAVLYNLIPITKPVGFNISSGALNAAELLNRHERLLDNNIEIVTNLSSLIVHSKEYPESRMMLTPDISGVIDSTTANIMCNSVPVLIISPKQYICTTIDTRKLQLRLIVKTGTDESTTEDSSRFINDYIVEKGFPAGTVFTPLRTTFTLEPYVLIEPLIDNEIRINLEGITEDNFNILWNRYTSMS